MLARKRRELTNERRRMRVAELTLRGVPQIEIAAELGVKQPCVSKDLTVVREHWLQSAIRAFDQHRAEELARISLVEAEAWKAWQESGGVKTKTKKVKLKSADPKAKASKTPDEVQTFEWYETGDPQYLKIVMDCVAQRCKLLGIAAPEKVAFTDPSGLHESKVLLYVPSNGRDEPAAAECPALEAPDGS